jgi:hypothetical protein
VAPLTAAKRDWGASRQTDRKGLVLDDRYSTKSHHRYCGRHGRRSAAGPWQTEIVGTDPKRARHRHRGYCTNTKWMTPLFTSLLPVFCATQAMAQDSNARSYPKVEIFAGFAAVETNDHSFQFADIGPVGHLDYDEKGRGFEAAVIGNLSGYLGIMGDFSAHFSSNEFTVPFPSSSTTQPGTINPRLFNFLVGPEVKVRNRSRLTPFVHALFGIAHSTATFKTTGPVINFSRTDAGTGFGMAFGGGGDVRITRRFSFRGMLTYRQAFVGSNELPRQRVNAVGWSSGVILH